MNSEDMDIEEAANIIGHCKINTMFDKENTKLVFVMPQIVDCGGKATTLGSVVSRLLRSMGFERKTGVSSRQIPSNPKEGVAQIFFSEKR